MQQVSRRIFFFYILIFGLAWIIVSRVTPDGTSGNTVSAPRKGFIAPDFTLATPSGENVTLSSLYGKAIILNFWASWCPPCRAEMPAFQAIHSQFHDQVIVLGINATSQDNLVDALAFLTENTLTFPILLDPDRVAQQSYAVTSLPTTFFIDQEGVITEVVVGGPMTEAGLAARLADLLAEGP